MIYYVVICGTLLLGNLKRYSSEPFISKALKWSVIQWIELLAAAFLASLPFHLTFENVMVQGIGIVKIHAQLIQGEIKIEIADTGKGIENIEIAKEPLYTTKPNLERSGMGFTIMESFMDSMEVESIVGLGTKVTMKKKIKKQDEQNNEEKMPNSTYAMSV